MSRFWIIFFSMLVPLWGGAEQTHSEDYLEVDGQGHYIRADPLNRYLSSYCSMNRLEDYVNNFCIPFWPNYTRYWEVEDDQLYLVKIENSDRQQYPLELLFPQFEGGPVLANWFSGIVSYRKDDSPLIKLNREFYEEEDVIRFVNGKEVERFTINHRERWLSYARRIMDRYRPLAGFSPDIPEVSTNSPVLMNDFLAEAFAVVTHPKEKPSLYTPVIAIKFKTDLNDFKVTEALGELSSYELLERIAEETGSALNTTISNRVVTYEIRRPKTGTKPPVAAPAAQGTDRKRPPGSAG
jgi:hypothetical protein